MISLNVQTRLYILVKKMGEIKLQYIVKLYIKKKSASLVKAPLQRKFIKCILKKEFASFMYNTIFFCKRKDHSNR